MKNIRMKQTLKTGQPGLNYMDEPEEWLRLTPAERMAETSKLWKFYLSMGGSLDPEPDPQSPFYFKEA